MRRRRREAADNLNLSFLDAISCGFGAVILLLVITMLCDFASIQATREEALASSRASRSNSRRSRHRQRLTPTQLSGPRW